MQSHVHRALQRYNWKRRQDILWRYASIIFQPAVSHYVNTLMLQLADPLCSTIMNYCRDGWPERHKAEPPLKPYWKVQGDLTIHDNLLLFQKRIVVLCTCITPPRNSSETLF
eukprot:Em0006g531a